MLDSEFWNDEKITPTFLPFWSEVLQRFFKPNSFRNSYVINGWPLSVLHKVKKSIPKNRTYRFQQIVNDRNLSHIHRHNNLIHNWKRHHGKVLSLFISLLSHSHSVLLGQNLGRHHFDKKLKKDVSLSKVFSLDRSRLILICNFMNVGMISHVKTHRKKLCCGSVIIKNGALTYIYLLSLSLFF